ncbi:hypothetical protein ASG11_03075 [Sphingomonas sp. Leaf357]|uniref:flagellar biosynthesis anti-sigma factor FlgM n=1 Tax=Sphingomonas sp. Leaf357 TaxID=1736350 RepID=UPI0006FFC1AF|nr:flagellar biosynthesis anti-sigma factor FlgM [Sphingomonas sp. Leaf357]KQS03365.1 hypothetical protein ASG11_03075 [Sphingomonas sp. Leaf357]
MVDPLGVKPVQTPVLTGERVAPVARVVPTAAVAPNATNETQAGAVSPSAVASIAKESAASAPVDLDRVARIRKAIADGNFPIYPSTIADRLIASKFDWLRNDAE